MMKKRSTKFVLLASLLVVVGMSVSAYGYNYFRRHYYSPRWSYNSGSRYHYRHYNYKPYSSYNGYRHHYAIYYPSRPRYVYYYNPYRRAYWGRYEVGSKDGAQYSLLADKDRKEDLEAIPESAFPKAGKMPEIPESKDGERMAPPPTSDLPKS